MERIRAAEKEDLCRIAEIQLFNFRISFYPFFLDDAYYFNQLQVTEIMKEYEPLLSQLYVYADPAVKGFVQVHDHEIRKLYVEPVLQNRGIGAALLEYACREHDASYLWALQLNTRAIRFYERHGFLLTEERKPEEGTEKMLIKMIRKGEGYV